MTEIETRMADLVNDSLMRVYWDGVKHFGTRDLVLSYVEGQSDEVSVWVRERMLAREDAPDFLRSKLAKPASEALTVMSSSDGSFWLAGVFSDGLAACVAVNARLLSKPGSA